MKLTHNLGTIAGFLPVRCGLTNWNKEQLEGMLKQVCKEVDFAIEELQEKRKRAIENRIICSDNGLLQGEKFWRDRVRELDCFLGDSSL